MIQGGNNSVFGDGFGNSGFGRFMAKLVINMK